MSDGKATGPAPPPWRLLAIVRGQVAGARPDREVRVARQPQLDPAEAAVALRVGRLVRDQVEGLVVREHPAEPGAEIVRVADEEPSGVAGQALKRLARLLFSSFATRSRRPGSIAGPATLASAPTGRGPGVEGVDDRPRAGGRVDHLRSGRVRSSLVPCAEKEAVRHQQAELAAGERRRCRATRRRPCPAWSLEKRGPRPGSARLALGFAPRPSRPGVVIDGRPRRPLHRPLSLDGRRGPAS